MGNDPNSAVLAGELKMGMFDYVHCEYPLLGLEDPTKIDFQTKDTDEMFLVHYRITKDGKLMRPVGRYEDRSDPECMTFVKEGEKVEPYTGILRFYGHTGELMSINLSTGKDEPHPGDEPEWFEALFDNGQLLSVKRVEN